MLKLPVEYSSPLYTLKSVQNSKMITYFRVRVTGSRILLVVLLLHRFHGHGVWFPPLINCFLWKVNQLSIYSM